MLCGVFLYGKLCSYSGIRTYNCTILWLASLVQWAYLCIWDFIQVHNFNFGKFTRNHILFLSLVLHCGDMLGYSASLSPQARITNVAITTTASRTTRCWRPSQAMRFVSAASSTCNTPHPSSLDSTLGVSNSGACIRRYSSEFLGAF